MDLPEDEFHNIYAELRECLKLEICLDTEEDDDASFLRACHRAIAEHHVDADRAINLGNAFLPLFERMQQARRAPRHTADGRVYRILFS